MLMNAFDKPVQSNTEQAGRGHGFARTFDRVCAFLDERVGGASALIAACQSVADRFWHSKLYFPVCFLMLAVFMARSEERRVGKECRSRWSPYH